MLRALKRPGGPGQYEKSATERFRLGETGPLSQGVQARRKALRIRHMNSMVVRKKRPRGSKKRSRGFR
jgi:hypothetical protein